MTILEQIATQRAAGHIFKLPALNPTADAQRQHLQAALVESEQLQATLESQLARLSKRCAGCTAKATDEKLSAELRAVHAEALAEMQADLAPLSAAVVRGKERIEGMRRAAAELVATVDPVATVAKELSRWIGQRIGDEAEAQAKALLATYLSDDPDAELVKVPARNAKERDPGEEVWHGLYTADGVLVCRLRVVIEAE